MNTKLLASLEELIQSWIDENNESSMDWSTWDNGHLAELSARAVGLVMDAATGGAEEALKTVS
jgi:hypothetical protein